MPFMFVSLAVMIAVTVATFFRTSPSVPEPGKVLVFNVSVLALAVPVAVAVGAWLYGDAVAAKANEKGMAVYLTVMAGGTAALLVVAVGGLVRNFVVFPLSKRVPRPADPA